MKKLIYILMIFAAMVFTFGCEGPEGDVGPQGYKGADGETGQAGESGEDGEDAVDGLTIYDFEKVTSTGSVRVVLEGMLPNDVELKDSIDFPYNLGFDYNNYSRMSRDDFEGNSWVYESEGGFTFNIYRSSNMISNDSKGRLVSRDGLYMYFSDSYGEFNFYDVYFRGIHLTKNYELYTIYLYDIEDYIEEVTGYYYDHSSGVLKLDVHAMIPGSENITENDLKVTIHVDVIVFKDDSPK